MNERSIFLEALEITAPAERAAFLDRAFNGNADLRKGVEGLLAANDRSGTFMRGPAGGDVTADFRPSEGPGSRVGPYKLLQEIGEGGMGVVYMAEQEVPVRRKVALKIIKPGMDSKQVVARFEAERQALGMMDHPNIARVFDAGTTDSGRPYFVMELVHGVPITEFCDANKLTPRERLELFGPVCQAIQHAHMKGIIHRDVKPSNVLVTMYDDKPVPKVIDFGVAKAVKQRLTEKTLFTQYGALVGTFEYMSPEQAEMNAFGVDTRSDVYSLGVLLYELLTGTTPLERQRLRTAAFGEVMRLIKEEEPPRPSLRISTSCTLAKVAAARKTEPGKLSRLVRGELDWIVMRCLEKDRTRRYDGVATLAKDVQRYLGGDAVEACPPTLGYRLHKAYRRNKAAVLVGTTFVGLVIGAAVMGFVLAVRATNAEHVASQDRDAALKAGTEATHQRNEARTARDRLRHSLYVSDLQMAFANWQSGDRARTLDLLDGQRPGPNESDLRGFEWYYLNRECRSATRSLSFPVGRKRITPDGTRVYSPQLANKRTDGKTGNTIRVWDVNTGQEFPEIDPFPGTKLENLNLYSFSRSGKRGIVNGSVRVGADTSSLKYLDKVIDLDSGQVLFDLPDLVDENRSVVMDGEGRRLGEIRTDAKGNAGSEVTIWSVDERKPLRTISLNADPKETFAVRGGRALDPGGKRFAAVTYLSGPKGTSRSHELRAWDVDTGEVLWRVPMDCGFRNNSIASHEIAYTPDGRYLTEASFDEAFIQLRDPGSGKVLHRLASPTAGGGSVQKIVRFSTDGARLAVGFGGRSGLHVWVVPVGTSSDVHPPLRTVATDDSFPNFAFTANSMSLVVASDKPDVSTHDLARRTVRLPAGPDAHRSPFGLTVLRATNLRAHAVWRLTTADRPMYEIRIWDSTGRLVFNVPVESLANSTDDWFSSILTPDGKRFILTQSYTHQTDATKDRAEIRIWDVNTKAEVSRHELPGKGEITIAALRPDGRQVALIRNMPSRPNTPNGTSRTRLMLWNLSENREEHGEEIAGYTSRYASPGTYSPDGSQVAFTMRLSEPVEREEVRVWDSGTGRTVWSRSEWPNRSRLGYLDLPTFTPDGRALIVPNSGSEMRSEIYLVDAATGRDLRPPLLSQTGRLRNFCVSEDGRRLYGTGTKQSNRPGESRVVVVWDLVSGRELLTLPTSSSFIWGLSTDREGHRLYLIKGIPGSSDVDLETYDGTPLEDPAK